MLGVDIPTSNSLGKTRKSCIPQTLLIKLGGDCAVGTLVDLLYDTILQDDKLGPFFSKSNTMQKNKLKVFLIQEFGGDKK